MQIKRGRQSCFQILPEGNSLPQLVLLLVNRRYVLRAKVPGIIQSNPHSHGVRSTLPSTHSTDGKTETPRDKALTKGHAFTANQAIRESKARTRPRSQPPSQNFLFMELPTWSWLLTVLLQMRPNLGEKRASHTYYLEMCFLKKKTWRQENIDHSYPFLGAKNKWEKKHSFSQTNRDLGRS